MTQINPDAAAMQQLQSRGVTEQTGVYGDHKVQLGNGKPIRLDSIKSNSIPFQGFRTVTKQARGLAGLGQCVKNTLKILTRPDGKFDAKALLSSVKTAAEYGQRLAKLDSQTVYAKQYADLEGQYRSDMLNLQIRYNSASPSEQGNIAEQIAKTTDDYNAQKEDLKNLVQKDIEDTGLVPVKTLSNSELAAIYQTFNSGQMDVLQTALMMEGRNNPEAKDARTIASALFDLQAQILKEVSDRAMVGMLEDQIADAVAKGDNDTAQELQGRLDELARASDAVSNENAPRTQSREDMSSANLRTLVETSAQSATAREKTALEQTDRLKTRHIDIQKVSISQMADVMRQSELTININTNVLLADGGVIDDPNSPMANIFHLADRGIKPKGDEYLKERDAVERLLYPEMSAHDVRADERPVYGALNVAHNITGVDYMVYGNAVIVLKPEVAQRATYIANDTFYAPAVSITTERRENFYKLLGGEKELPGDLAKCLNKESPERKALDDWLDKIKKNGKATIAQFTNFPGELGLNNEDQQSLFKAVLVKCFGDAEQTRKIMATHDNLEALIPHMTNLNGNSLARAAMEAAEGRSNKIVLTGAKYIEAQIQGPIVPSRDIAEIRIITDYEDPMTKDQLASLRGFEKQTGIKVKIMGSPDDPISTQDTDNQATIYDAQLQFNQKHLDEATINAIAEDYLQNFEQKLKDYIDNDPRLADVAQELDLGGNALTNCKTSFYSKITDDMSNPSRVGEEPQSYVGMTFEEVVRPILTKKAELIRHVNTLTFENPQEQRAAFVRWVCDSKALTSVEEINIVHEFATKQADFFRQVYNSDPPMSNEDMIKGMTQIAMGAAPSLDAFIATLNKPDYGTDDKYAQVDRISFMSETLLRTANPPMTQAELRTIYDRINSPQMKALRAQLSEIGQRKEDDHMNKLEGMPVLRTVTLLWFANARNIGSHAGVNVRSDQELQGPDFNAELSLLGNEARSIVRDIAPQVAEVLDHDHPPYKPFPVAKESLRLPDGAGRRDFLVKHLNTYMEHERTFDRNFTHGRGHVVRAFIYGAVMCSMLEEMGVSMDRNAVLCGITMHDSGRQGNGHDAWEGDSANNAVDAMRTDFAPAKPEEKPAVPEEKPAVTAENRDEPAEKPDVLGEEYAEELKKCIAGHDGETVEAMLLNAADSLDIGRTQEFDPNLFPFLLGKEREGESITGRARQWRAQLIAEADLLQRLTNPSCSWRNALNHLQQAAYEDDEHADVYMQQKQELVADIRETFEKEWNLTAEDYVRQYEDIIEANPQLFPLFSRYYRP